MPRSINSLLCFGGSIASEQLAFARVVPDDAIFAYLGDVFLLPEHQRRGYSKVLMDAVMTHSNLQGLRRPATSDAHGL
ncbi:GNAT family N-acetyltransferase [Xanthomonas vasicola]|uniref:GNAT family N-acetyltransferase n=1 Tax=Xanthomonas vasicola TaxID=56459 RepID=UPI000531FA29|nr:GNAT family N-acetyltransferase [Xanthomonas vasicola]AZR35757.1 N-acetyltransferase [Xanthomonas vasicola]KGR51214.1 hypothetical protein NX07_14365 [Xanthomonas vasicola]KGR57727.1 hypothetical protein NX09_03030 [Xanthomonas vasicola]KGT83114.1 hypothetical protein OC00_15425 [Xanthomonas vasicola]